MCEISTSLKKRFCADNNLSISLFQEPYFMDRIKLFGEEENYNEFIKFLENYKSEEEFFTVFNKIKDDAINFIKTSAAFTSFNEADMQKLAVHNFSFPDRDAYKQMNIGRKFFSIDMKKANFTSLKYYAKKTGTEFCGDKSYQEFLRMFTDIEHFINSKSIRQVIFGNCSSKRVSSYEKIMMSNVLQQMFDKNVVTEDIVYALRNDEILIDITNLNDESIEKLKDFSKSIDFEVESEIYTIKKIKDEDIYIKDFGGDNFEIKMCSVEDMPAVYRFVKNLPPDENDLYFYHNGRLSKFVEAKTFEYA